MPGYYGQFNPPVDRIIHERYFRDKRNGIAIECGAYDGLVDSCTKFFEENYGWKCINIEPLSNVYEKLVVNRPTSVNLQIALSDNNSVEKFRNYKHPSLGYDWGNGSLNHTQAHKQDLENLCGKDNYIEHD